MCGESRCDKYCTPSGECQAASSITLSGSVVEWMSAAVGLVAACLIWSACGGALVLGLRRQRNVVAQTVDPERGWEVRIPLSKWRSAVGVKLGMRLKETTLAEGSFGDDSHARYPINSGENVLEVTAVDEGALVNAIRTTLWERSLSGVERVQDGDLVVAVNGRTGQPAVLRQLLLTNPMTISFRRPRPVHLNLLPLRTITAEDAVTTCNICLDTIQAGDEVRDLHCKHFFHRGCADTWLAMSGTCPLCRSGSLKGAEVL
jgi:hypothetical protein